MPSPTMEIMPKLAVSVPQAAGIAGLSRSNLYKLVMEGKVKSIKIGTRRLIRMADLEAWLNEQTVAAK